MYRQMSSDPFSPECLLECLDLSSEHQAIEVANRIEASIYVWWKKNHSKPANNNSNRPSSKSSWELVKEMMMDGEKRDLLAERAESLLLCLKQWFPGLPQTALDMSKIQYNKVCTTRFDPDNPVQHNYFSFKIIDLIQLTFYVRMLGNQSWRATQGY